jgi:uncharacterized membrane protein YedE/YeeE
LYATSSLEEDHMQLITALLAGLLFGIGLIVSGMTDPAKVLGFLDLAGAWNPALAWVMAGALLVSALGFALVKRRKTALLGGPFHLPTAKLVDRRLLLGSLAFGAGWGLAGYCPGPALASVLTGGAKPLVFVAAMLAGMAVFELLERRRSRK